VGADSIELGFLFGLAYLDESQTFVQPAGIRVVFLDSEVEWNAGRRGLCLEVLDDGGADAVALDIRKQLNAAELDAVGSAGNPQPAGALINDLDHAGRATGDVVADSPHRALSEALLPLRFIFQPVRDGFVTVW
jgi:hypothetical protein